jgi:hypothetical protein
VMAITPAAIAAATLVSIDDFISFLVRFCCVIACPRLSPALPNSCFGVSDQVEKIRSMLGERVKSLLRTKASLRYRFEYRCANGCRLISARYLTAKHPTWALTRKVLLRHGLRNGWIIADSYMRRKNLCA